MTQENERKKRSAGDEGAAYTSEVVAEVKRLRQGMKPAWSAERLAREMTKAGVPWTRDSVVNLENGRRKRLAVHELLALAYVLEVDSPVDLLAPLSPAVSSVMYATPRVLVTAAAMRAWCERRTGPLGQWMDAAAEDSTGDDDPAARATADSWAEFMSPENARAAVRIGRALQRLEDGS